MELRGQAGIQERLELYNGKKVTDVDSKMGELEDEVGSV